MIWTAAHKYLNITPPAAIVDNTAYVTTEIDTKGFRYLTILGILGATDIALVAWKMTESDTAGSGHADITGLVSSGTTGDGRLATATDDNGILGFFIDLKGRKRYLDVVATAGDGAAGTYLTVIAILSRAEESPNTTAERGLTTLLRLPAA